ncbi:coiled-coil domain-containing protein 107 isoform X4 [Macaca mulatta]|uniref:coiled-coil domain-containing protein 107 isoform X4 n=1 Tax=Theropithecus gelada TaxID=9565 RepID=UPI000DC1A60E|nr:coiled-coil domain-containing protein 107 isoform X4 [Theropithecus gelada]
MAGPVSLFGMVGLLLVSALPGVLGDRASPDLRAHPGNAAHPGSGATEPRRRPPLKDQRERARAGSLPLGALYTAAVVAFVLYKCLQGKDETAVLHKEASKQQPLQSEQQLAQLTQQLAQTEQHLNNLMAQLDPLFERPAGTSEHEATDHPRAAARQQAGQGYGGFRTRDQQTSS